MIVIAYASRKNFGLRYYTAFSNIVRFEEFVVTPTDFIIIYIILFLAKIKVLVSVLVGTSGVFTVSILFKHRTNHTILEFQIA